MAAVLAHRQRSSAALLLGWVSFGESPNTPSHLLCVCSKKLKWYALCPVVDAINHSSLVQVGALHSIPVLPLHCAAAYAACAAAATSWCPQQPPPAAPTQHPSCPSFPPHALSSPFPCCSLMCHTNTLKTTLCCQQSLHTSLDSRCACMRRPTVAPATVLLARAPAVLLAALQLAVLACPPPQNQACFGHGLACCRPALHHIPHSPNSNSHLPAARRSSSLMAPRPTAPSSSTTASLSWATQTTSTRSPPPSAASQSRCVWHGHAPCVLCGWHAAVCAGGGPGSARGEAQLHPCNSSGQQARQLR